MVHWTGLYDGSPLSPSNGRAFNPNLTPNPDPNPDPNPEPDPDPDPNPELVWQYLLEVTITVNTSSVPGSTLKNCANPNPKTDPNPIPTPIPNRNPNTNLTGGAIQGKVSNDTSVPVLPYTAFKWNALAGIDGGRRDIA